MEYRLGDAVSVILPHRAERTVDPGVKDPCLKGSYNSVDVSVPEKKKNGFPECSFDNLQYIV